MKTEIHKMSVSENNTITLKVRYEKKKPLEYMYINMETEIHKTSVPNF